MTYIKLFLVAFFVALSFPINAQSDTITSHLVDLKFSRLKNQLQSAQKKKDSVGIAHEYIRLGDFYKNLWLDSEAVKQYHMAQSFYSKTDTVYVYLNNQLAEIHHGLKQFEEAQLYLKQSLEVSKTLNYKKGLARTNALFGSVAEKEKRYEDALRYETTSFELFKVLNDSLGLAVTNENIGSIYEDLEQYDVAYQYFKAAFNYVQHSNSDIKINIINNLGDVNRKLGKYEKALEYTQQALKLARQTKNGSQEESALKDLARTYAEMGEFDKAYHYLTDQTIANEQELKRHNSELVSSLQILHEVKEQETQVELLNKQNQLSQTRQLTILLCSVALTVIFIIILFYFKRKKKQESTIIQYEQQLLEADLERKIAKEKALKREIDIQVSALTNYSLNLAQKNKMLSEVSRTLASLKDRNSELIKNKLESLSKDIEIELSQQNEWSELLGFFGKIHPGFFEKLKAEALEELSMSDLRLCMLIRLNLSSKDMASILHITPDSVRIARYRMRKKLPLQPKEKLDVYLANV
ncbi:tetratricopeptide repeat protein [Aestuariibaculum suncheonense]|uniref:Tetratricopeptide repeat protein n=1 Tax=Aestuariibaculum suncheonense TaxID=1028745 RepID=A0A8J6Q3P7_9FLAO|nr:tetratricopeptide repeat protein [Aestuariibaculum suncheonense]MBD0834052.1 tetratricopeptide repeat protein [Aestuariibaculum suncheonense]